MQKYSDYKMKYNREHFVRIPLDATMQEYNAIREYAESIGSGVNTLLRGWIKEHVPAEIMEKHKNDKERERG